MGTQNAAKKVLELTEKWNTQISELDFRFLSKIFWKQESQLQLLGIHYFGAFCITLLSFFVLKIFGFS